MNSCGEGTNTPFNINALGERGGVGWFGNGRGPISFESLLRREKTQECFDNRKRTPKVQQQLDSSEFQLELSPDVNAAARAKRKILPFLLFASSFLLLPSSLPIPAPEKMLAA